MTIRSTTSLLAAIALATGTGLALAQQGTSASLVTRDEDGDGIVTKQEYMSQGDEAMFNEFDTDSSGDIDQEEFSAGMFGIADTNDDDELSAEELENIDTARGFNEEVD